MKDTSLRGRVFEGPQIPRWKHKNYIGVGESLAYVAPLKQDQAYFILTHLPQTVQIVYIFGSSVRFDYDPPTSDLDVLIVSSNYEEDYYSLMQSIEVFNKSIANPYNYNYSVHLVSDSISDWEDFKRDFCTVEGQAYYIGIKAFDRDQGGII